MVSRPDLNEETDADVVNLQRRIEWWEEILRSDITGPKRELAEMVVKALKGALTALKSRLAN